MLEDPTPSGTAKGKVSDLPTMLPEYYKLRGWTEAGEPTPRPCNAWGLADPGKGKRGSVTWTM